MDKYVAKLYEITERAERELEKEMKERRVDKFKMLDDAVEKIEEFYDNLLDSIKGDTINFSITLDGKEYDFHLRNNDFAKIAKVSGNLDNIILNKNGYGKDIHHNKSFDETKKYYSLIRKIYDSQGNITRTEYKSSFISLHIKNRDKIENKLTEEIQKSIGMKMKEIASAAAREAEMMSNLEQFLK